MHARLCTCVVQLPYGCSAHGLVLRRAWDSYQHPLPWIFSCTARMAQQPRSQQRTTIPCTSATSDANTPNRNHTQRAHSSEGHNHTKMENRSWLYCHTDLSQAVQCLGLGGLSACHHCLHILQGRCAMTQLQRRSRAVQPQCVLHSL